MPQVAVGVTGGRACPQAVDIMLRCRAAVTAAAGTVSLMGTHFSIKAMVQYVCWGFACVQALYRLVLSTGDAYTTTCETYGMC
jgi:hypothetical protein